MRKKKPIKAVEMVRRIRDAHFPENKTLESFDWEFNAQVIDRVQIEELATGDFLRRAENLLVVGQSGIGKSHLLEGIGRRACDSGYVDSRPRCRRHVCRCRDSGGVDGKGEHRQGTVR